jgi:hypothetical protein
MNTSPNPIALAVFGTEHGLLSLDVRSLFAVCVVASDKMPAIRVISVSGDKQDFICKSYEQASDAVKRIHEARSAYAIRTV